VSQTIPPESNFKSHPQSVISSKAFATRFTVSLSTKSIALQLHSHPYTVLDSTSTGPDIESLQQILRIKQSVNCPWNKNQDTKKTSTLMSVDIRQSLHCLRFPSRYETVSRTQLSKQHTGDSTRPAEKPSCTSISLPECPVLIQSSAETPTRALFLEYFLTRNHGANQ